MKSSRRQDLKAVYYYGKTMALKAADDFMRAHHPHFSVSYIFPGEVFGRNELASSVAELQKGSNANMLGLIAGVDFPAPRVSGAA